MTQKVVLIICMVSSLCGLGFGLSIATPADDLVKSTETRPQFQPGDQVVVRKTTAVRSGVETLAMVDSGTHFIVGKINPPWLATSLQQDGKKVAGWISSHDVSPVLKNSIGMRLVPIPAGEFLMGNESLAADDAQEIDDERPRHQVRITRSFHLGAHEVTVSQFRRFVSETGYETDSEQGTEFVGAFGYDPQTGALGESAEYSWQSVGFDQTDDHPVVNVSWNDAVAFCEWLTRKEGRPYRLPTEAEWEYGCRSGTATAYFHGDESEGLALVANVADASAKAKFPDWEWSIKANDGYDFSAPVGSFKPNAWGLYDMHGNVYEWCADFYAEDYYAHSPTDDPMGPSVGFDRVYRGGSWASEAANCRAASRSVDEPAGRSLVLGFRVVLDSRASKSSPSD
jgi:formylglycine-generating enzyme required for sulfatase activity